MVSSAAGSTSGANDTGTPREDGHGTPATTPAARPCSLAARRGAGHVPSSGPVDARPVRPATGPYPDDFRRHGAESVRSKLLPLLRPGVEYRLGAPIGSQSVVRIGPWHASFTSEGRLLEEAGTRPAGRHRRPGAEHHRAPASPQANAVRPLARRGQRGGQAQAGQPSRPQTKQQQQLREPRPSPCSRTAPPSSMQRQGGGATVQPRRDGTRSPSSSRSRRPTRSSRCCPSSAPARQARHHARPAAQRDPAAGPRASTTRPYWHADFNTAYYEELFNGAGESIKDYYRKQSSGRYTVSSTPSSDWVKVPGNASTYGDNAVEDNGGSWAFIDDTVDAWYADAGRGRQDRRRDRRLPGAVRRLGPLRLRQRRQLQRARRLHRPLPGRARRRGRGGRRATRTPSGRTAGTSAPTTAPPGPTVGGKPTSCGGTQIGDSELLHRRLHRRARERRPRRLRPRVRPRPRPARTTTTPPAARTAPAFWTLMSSGSWLGHGEARRRGHRHHAPA